MEYVNLGKTGLKVSRICLGCMTYGSPERRPWALEADQSLPFFIARSNWGSISSIRRMPIPTA